MVAEDVLVRLEFVDVDDRRDSEAISLYCREDEWLRPLSDTAVGESGKVGGGRINGSFNGAIEEVNCPNARVLLQRKEK